ncbi:MAG: ABC transporter substrate-binding protein [Deltaproteobacteria bacterium]|nr:ABC transporter substrate-binding protein [Deltaproteobacteria bacterium]
MKRVRMIRLACLAILTFGLTCGVASPLQGAGPIKVGTLPVISSAPLFIGQELGLFKEEGLEIELVEFASGAKMMSPLATGELQVAAGSSSAGLFNAIAGGMDLKVVADKGQARAGYNYSLIVVRKDLAASGAIREVKDLRGRKIAVAARGIFAEYLLEKLLAQAGLLLNAVELVGLSPPNMVKALHSKAIDAAVAVEPWGTRSEAEGVGVKAFTAELDRLEPHQTGMLMVPGAFLRQRPDDARRFMRAYLKGVRYFNQRGLKDPGMSRLLTKYTRVPEEIIRASVPFYLAEDGRLLKESLADQQEWYARKGLVKERVSIERMVDESLLRP